MSKGWGGARNRRDRVSMALSSRQCVQIIKAVKQAIAKGTPLNRMATFHWQAMGFLPADVLQNQMAFLAKARGWAKKRGQPIAWVWIRENDFGDGSKGEHSHILFHLPEPIVRECIDRMAWGWLKQLGARRVRGALRWDTIGRRANDYRTAPAVYDANLQKLVCGYLLKGADKQAAHELGLPRHGDGGRIVGKRWGRSQNLGAN